MSVQRQRLSAVARNIANANTTKADDGKPYQREVVSTRQVGSGSFEKQLFEQLALQSSDSVHTSNAKPFAEQNRNSVVEAETMKDTTPPRQVYDPAHPDADENGYVAMPNINIVTEMVEMISAQRAFEANAGVTDAAKNIARYSLEI